MPDNRLMWEYAVYQWGVKIEDGFGTYTQALEWACRKFKTRLPETYGITVMAHD